jgi:DNA-directed RNA polymerase subunit RPC12/RpoP
MISFSCPGCAAVFSVGDEMAGKTGSCPKCQTRFAMPGVTTADPLTPPRVPSRSDVEIAPCPGCRAKLTVASRDLGLDVECPYCKSVYRAMAVGTAAMPPVPRSPRRRFEDETEEDEERLRSGDADEEGDRPRQRRRSNRASALEAVSAPAICLMVLGMLGLLYGTANLALNLAGFNNQQMMAIQNQNQNKPGFNAGFQIGYVIGVALPGLWGVVVLLAGINLKRLAMLPSVWIGTIFSMLPCNPCCLLGIPFGIWTITVLNRPDVKQAFE